MATEFRLIEDSGPPVELMDYTNISGASLSITNHEIFAINAGAGYRLAAAVHASAKTATNGTLAANEKGSIITRGRGEVPKNTSQAFEQGESVFWDAGNNEANTRANAGNTDDFHLGQVAKPAAAADEYCEVDLNVGPLAFNMGSSSSSSSSSAS